MAKRKLIDAVIFPQWKEQEMQEAINASEEGNIPSMLKIVMHNQRILLKKLNLLLKKKHDK